MNECEKYAIIREMAEALEDCISAMKSAQCIIDCEKCASRKTCIRHKAINALKKAKELMEREETFDEVIAEMNWAHDANVSTDAVGIASYASRLKAAHEREVEDVLRERNDFHAALLTICTANTDSRGLREIAVDACNNRGCDK